MENEPRHLGLALQAGAQRADPGIHLGLVLGVIESGLGHLGLVLGDLRKQDLGVWVGGYEEWTQALGGGTGVGWEV